LNVTECRKREGEIEEWKKIKEGILQIRRREKNEGERNDKMTGK
jgi:hypothetical protein